METNLFAILTICSKNPPNVQGRASCDRLRYCWSTRNNSLYTDNSQTTGTATTGPKADCWENRLPVSSQIIFYLHGYVSSASTKISN